MKKYFLPIGKRQEEVLLPEERVIYDIQAMNPASARTLLPLLPKQSVTRSVPSLCEKLCMQAKL